MPVVNKAVVLVDAASPGHAIHKARAIVVKDENWKMWNVEEFGKIELGDVGVVKGECPAIPEEADDGLPVPDAQATGGIGD